MPRLTHSDRIDLTLSVSEYSTEEDYSSDADTVTGPDVTSACTRGRGEGARSTPYPRPGAGDTLTDLSLSQDHPIIDLSSEYDRNPVYAFVVQTKPVDDSKDEAEPQPSTHVGFTRPSPKVEDEAKVKPNRKRRATKKLFADDTSGSEDDTDSDSSTKRLRFSLEQRNIREGLSLKAPDDFPVRVESVLYPGIAPSDRPAVLPSDRAPFYDPLGLPREGLINPNYDKEKLVQFPDASSEVMLEGHPIIPDAAYLNPRCRSRMSSSRYGFDAYADIPSRVHAENTRRLMNSYDSHIDQIRRSIRHLSILVSRNRIDLNHVNFPSAYIRTAITELNDVWISNMRR
jgi:hypothetical protein